MCAHAHPCINSSHCVHWIIIVPSIVPSFTPHLFTAADAHILFLLRPLAAAAVLVPVSVVPSNPSFIIISATVAAAAAAAVLVVASCTFSALIVATLSSSSSDRSPLSTVSTVLW